MYQLDVPSQLYKAIANGQRSCLILEEREEFITSSEIEVRCVAEPEEETPIHSMICSINHIETHKEEKGLKKDYAMIGISVVRHLF